MRILYVTDAFAVWGGMERVLADKMNYLVGQYGYEVSLLTVNQGDHSFPFQLHHGIRHTDLQIQMHQQYKYLGVRRLLIRRKLKRLLKSRIDKVINEIQPDIILCVKFDFVGVLYHVKGDIPLIVESHTLYKVDQIDGSGWLRRFHVYLFKRCIRKADAIVALTEGDAADWRKISSKVFVIPNVVHLNNCGRCSSCLEKSVIFVGRFTKQKDFPSLLQIWQKVHQIHPDWRLEVYGDGELKEQISATNSAIMIHEPSSNIMEEYVKHSILILTSLYEPFGLVLPEAMSCGLPVVAFDCPYGPADIITDGVDGFLIKDRDIEAFADRVCQLIESEELRCQMGKQGVVSSQRYRADRIMPMWNRLFQELAAHASSPKE